MSHRNLFRLFAAAAPAGDHVSDRELLRRFIATRDSAAFELIARRHADAVWAAGLRILGNAADAEDVFQATFLALVRKAGSVRGECIGGYLHRVAVNAALKLRSRRTPTVREGVDVESHPVADTPGSPEQVELAAIVQEELARLPDRYRLPVVLCDLEGQTHAEAAQALGWPIGSVSGRLSRAHVILRDRLTRRGLAAPVALVAAATAPASAVHAATAVAAGSAIASPVVASLTEGVLSAMRIAKLKLAAAVVAATGFAALAGVGTGYALTRPGPTMSIALTPVVPANVAQADVPKAEDWTSGRSPSAFPELKAPEPGDKDRAAKLLKACPLSLGDDPPAVVAADDIYRRLLKARLQQRRLYQIRIEKLIAVGGWNTLELSLLLGNLSEMRATAQELWGIDPKVLLPWLEEFVILGKYYERVTETRVATGNDPPQNLYLARSHRLEAEAALWKAKKQRG